MKILCTLGPSSLNEKVIKKLTAEGVSLFRLNLSHMKFEDLAGAVELIRSFSSTPICFDTEGAQVRTGYTLTGKSVFFGTQEKVKISKNAQPREEKEIGLTPAFVVDQLKVGDLLTLDFNSLLLVVEEAGAEFVTARVLEPGLLGNNKAVTLRNGIDLPPFSEKDLRAFKLGKELGIAQYALSFAHRPEDVINMRKELPAGAKIISKIECVTALKNLAEIVEQSDAILIDRGDLSREVGIEYIPVWQKKIIHESNFRHKEVFVATNFLESMISNPTPTRAEVNDIYNTLLDGGSGIVLAAETAVGSYPVQAVRVVKKMMKIYKDEGSLAQTSNDGSLSLIAPHGGQLILKESFVSEAELGILPQLAIDEKTAMDCELICDGTYSPVTGLMNAQQIQNVLKDYKYGAHFWPLPIFLSLPDAKALEGKDSAVLTSEKFGFKFILENLKIENMDPQEMSQDMFRTSDLQHPGVAWLRSKGSCLVSGNLKKLKNSSEKRIKNSFSPRELRFIFEKKSWAKVVAFHTRNIPHKAHEYIQQKAVERVGADGLLISPVIGPKKLGDFEQDLIIDCYKAAIEKGTYAHVDALVSGFFSYSRYAGPREALFTAICRQNMGCTHLIVGRDHTGVGEFYGPYESQKAFEKYADQLEISPIFFDEVRYLENEGVYEESKTPQGLKISASLVRELLKGGREVPQWLIRDEVYQIIDARRRNGQKIYVE